MMVVAQIYIWHETIMSRICAHMPTCTHTYMHTHARTCPHTHACTCTRNAHNAHACTHICTHMCTHVPMCTHMHVHTYEHTCTRDMIKLWGGYQCPYPWLQRHNSYVVQDTEPNLENRYTQTQPQLLLVCHCSNTKCGNWFFFFLKRRGIWQWWFGA